jgi:uncharacterized protein YbcC (UPF0753/DUF2309 family)
LVIAPRARTRGLALDGRVFLHDYDPAQDPRQLLEQLMTAPMLVPTGSTGSTTPRSATRAPGQRQQAAAQRGGRHIGVFEGNGGDLRIGLSASRCTTASAGCTSRCG